MNYRDKKYKKQARAGLAFMALKQAQIGLENTVIRQRGIFQLIGANLFRYPQFNNVGILFWTYTNPSRAILIKIAQVLRCK